MVLLTTTPHILELISSLPTSAHAKLLDTSVSLPSNPDSPISHSALLSLSHLCRDHGISRDASLNTLLRGTRPYFPPPPMKPEPTPEYKALMARLRADQERREYNALLSKETQDSLAADDDGEEDVISPSLVLNILLSIVFCAVAVFHVSKYWANDGIRVLMSLGAGIVVGIAEVTVYAGYVRNVKQSKIKEKSKKEKKVLIGEYRGEADLGDAQSVILQDGDKEVIWGRGKHGGMRRRVREKWEKEQDSSNRKETTKNQ